jgi:hypothetical protein
VVGIAVIVSYLAWRGEMKAVNARLARWCWSVALAIAVTLPLLNMLMPREPSQYAPFPSIPLLLADRATYGIFPDVYPKLSARTRKQITPADASFISQHRRNLNLAMKRIYNSDPALGRRMSREMISVSLRIAPLKVLGFWSADVLANLTPGISFQYLRFGSDNFSTWTELNMSRQIDRPKLVAAYLNINAISILARIGCLAILLTSVRLRKTLLASLWPMLLAVGAFILVDAFTYATFSNMFHIRYALPLYVTIVASSFVLLLQGLVLFL